MMLFFLLRDGARWRAEVRASRRCPHPRSTTSSITSARP
jgi:hypothetical protein